MNELFLNLNDFTDLDEIDEMDFDLDEASLELPNHNDYVEDYKEDYAFPSFDNEHSGVPLPHFAYRDVRPFSSVCMA